MIVKAIKQSSTNNHRSIKADNCRALQCHALCHPAHDRWGRSYSRCLMPPVTTLTSPMLLRRMFSTAATDSLFSS